MGLELEHSWGRQVFGFDVARKDYCDRWSLSLEVTVEVKVEVTSDVATSEVLCVR